MRPNVGVIAMWTLALVAGSASAQRGQRSGGAPQRDSLATEVLNRFMNQFQQQAGLTAEQNDRFRPALLKNVQARRDQQRREREAWQALESQMRPGVAANADSVTKLLDAVYAARQAQLDLAKVEQREYAAYLNAVQRAQLAIQWERLMNQIEVIRRRPLGRVQGPGK